MFVTAAETEKRLLAVLSLPPASESTFFTVGKALGRCLEQKAGVDPESHGYKASQVFRLKCTHPQRATVQAAVTDPPERTGVERRGRKVLDVYTERLGISVQKHFRNSSLEY